MLRSLVKKTLTRSHVLQRNPKSWHWIPKSFSQSLATNPRNNPFKEEQESTNEKPTFETTLVDDEKRKKILALELEMAYQEGRRVPELSFLKDDHWNHVLTLPSKSARFRYYNFLWQIEKKKENQKIKKEERAIEIRNRNEELKRQSEENGHIDYGLSRTTMFLRIYDTAINNFNNNRLIQAMRFGEKIVIDCSYDDNMNRHESVNTAKQFGLCFAENRLHDEPFDLHFCNANLEKLTMKTVLRQIPTMLDADFPMNVHENCFTELFPKENLVYLTPHCRTDLQKYNPDDIYIIGGIVDKVNQQPLSLAKSKRLGLRMARLPLDRYLSWGSGSGKSLTINQMINIMLDLKKTKDWTYALRHVPRRKLNDSDTTPVFHKSTLKRKFERLAFNPDNWATSKKIV